MTVFCSVLVAPCADGVPRNPRDSTVRPTDQPAVLATAVSPHVTVPSSTVLLGSGGEPPWGTGPGLRGGHGCDPCQPLPSWVVRRRRRRVHWVAGGPHGSSQDEGSMNWTAQT